MNKIIFVEGKTDKKVIMDAGVKNIEIICTYGTVSYDRLEQLLDDYEHFDCYLLFDEDYSGDKLRKQFLQAFPTSTIIRIPKEFKEVAETPVEIIQQLLMEKYLI